MQNVTETPPYLQHLTAPVRRDPQSAAAAPAGWALGHIAPAGWALGHIAPAGWALGHIAPAGWALGHIAPARRR